MYLFKWNQSDINEVVTVNDSSLERVYIRQITKTLMPFLLLFHSSERKKVQIALKGKRLQNYFACQTPIKQKMILFSQKQNPRLFLLHNQEMVAKFHLVQYLNGNISDTGISILKKGKALNDEKVR